MDRGPQGNTDRGNFTVLKEDLLCFMGEIAVDELKTQHTVMNFVGGAFIQGITDSSSTRCLSAHLSHHTQNDEAHLGVEGLSKNDLVPKCINLAGLMTLKRTFSKLCMQLVSTSHFGENSMNVNYLNIYF